MKLRGLKNCRVEDKKRGVMVNLAIGETIDIDQTEKEQAEQIHVLLYSGKAVITDEKIIPMSGKYRVLRPYHYLTPDGFPRLSQLGGEIILNQGEACELLLSGCVEPVAGDGWTPKKLLEPAVKGNIIKKMFDVAGEPPKNWTREYGHIKGGNK